MTESVLDPGIWGSAPGFVVVHIFSFLFPEKRPWHDTYRVPGHDPKTATFEECLMLLDRSPYASIVKKYKHQWIVMPSNAHHHDILWFKMRQGAEIAMNTSLEITVRSPPFPNTKRELRKLLAETGFNMDLKFWGSVIRDNDVYISDGPRSVYDYMVYRKDEKTWKITSEELASPMLTSCLYYHDPVVEVTYDSNALREPKISVEEVYFAPDIRGQLLGQKFRVELGGVVGTISSGVFRLADKLPPHDRKFVMDECPLQTIRGLPPNVKILSSKKQ